MDQKAQEDQLQWTIDKLTILRDKAEQKLADHLGLMEKTMTELEMQSSETVVELKTLKDQYQAMQSYAKRPEIVDQWVGEINHKLDDFNPKQDWPYPAAGLLILVLLIAWFWATQKPKAAKASVFDLEEDEDEYDFLGSEEGIPAKLDLARAYFAMEDRAAAIEVLEDVIAKGSEEQQKEAKELLASTT